MRDYIKNLPESKKAICPECGQEYSLLDGDDGACEDCIIKYLEENNGWLSK